MKTNIRRIIVAAVVALFVAAQAAAQQTVPFFTNFDDGSPSDASPTASTAATSSFHGGNTSATGTMYADGWRGYVFRASNQTSPHLVSGSGNFVYRISGSKSLSLCCRAGHGTYPDPAIVLLPTFDKPINQLKIKFWFATSTAVASELMLSVGYVTGTNYTSSTAGATVAGDFVSLQSISASAASYCTSTGLQSEGKGQWVEVSLSDAPSNATRIAIRLNVPGGALRYSCIDDLTVDLNATCPAVSNLHLLATPEATQASIAWTEEGPATQWKVTLNDGTPLTVSSTSHTFTGLTPNTEYTASVVALCDDDEESGATTITFRTPCAPISDLPLTETFESYETISSPIDPCWYTAKVGTSVGIAVYPNDRGSGGSSRSLFMSSLKSSQYHYTYAVLPALSVPLNELKIEFDLKRNNQEVFKSSVQLGVIKDPADISTFTPLYTFDLSDDPVNTERHYRISLSAYQGEGRLAFYNPVPTAYAENQIDIDNVVVDRLPACMWPEDIAVASISDDELTIKWRGSASGYEVQMSTVPDFSSEVTTSTVSTNTISIPGVQVGHTYYFRIRATCGSEWSDVFEVYMVDFSSAPASGLYPGEGKVVLNDLEPHSWSLYSKDVDKPLRVLDPIDVRITYRGYGTNNVSSNTTYNANSQSESGYVEVLASDFTANCAQGDVSVGISADERMYHTFEYFKTLERLDSKTAELEASGRAEYRTIFNPFSRRPTYGNPADYDWATTSSLNGAPCWRGFYMWRIDRIAGGDIYALPNSGAPLAVGSMVKADQKLFFEPSSTTGMEVDFTAMWAPAIVRFHTGEDQSNVPSRAHGAFDQRTIAGVERNFLICDGVMYLPTGTQSISPFLPLSAPTDDAGHLMGEGKFACTYTSVFPNGTIDGVTPAYGPVKESVTTSRVTRKATYIDLCPEESVQVNGVAGFNSDTRFEYLAFSRLRGVYRGFHLDGSYAAVWGTIAGTGRANLTLGRGIVPMFDDNKGTFNYIWGVGPISANQSATWVIKRNENNFPINSSGIVIDDKASHPGFPKYELNYNVDYTIRVESGYIGCAMTMSGWNANYQGVTGKDLVYAPGNSTSKTTPANRIKGDDNHCRFIMGCDFDRADEAQRVRELGTDYAALGYASLDSMLYHEIYKNAKVKFYRPFRVSSFSTQMNYQNKDSIYSTMIIKSGFVGQESIDRGFGHEDGATGQSNKPGRTIVDGIERGHWMVHSIYNVASNNNHHRGKRRLTIEGGFLNCSVSLGAWDRSNDLTRWTKPSETSQWGPYVDGTSTPNDVSTLRMTGGIITGALFGGGNTYTASGGGRQMTITGGTVRAWIAGGVNGSDAQPVQWEGIHFGNTWIYAGGTLHVGSGDTTRITVGDTIYHEAYCGINGTTDGQIFGAGCGIKPYYFRADSVEVDHQWNMNGWKHHRMGRVDSSFIYIADQVEVEGDVYGGGNYGYNNTDDGDDYNPAWTGAANSTGDPSYPAKGKATLRIIGGEVGGRVFGGANRKMGPEVDILMTDGLVKRGIYGGSNTWGYIRKDVTINIMGGTIGTPEEPAIVCGGGLGKETAVFGNVTLNIGAAGTAGPTIYGDVYGGSQNGTTNAGSTTKTEIGTFNQNPSHGSGGAYKFYSLSIDTADAQGYGYNPAHKTSLNIRSGLIDGSVYGGGYGPNNFYASTYGDVEVNFLGGEVMQDIFGANNASGKPMGLVKVNIGSPDSVAASEADGDRRHRNRPVVHGSVYGGGNNASYGNAPDNYTTLVEMFSGTVLQHVFGGGKGTDAVVNHDNETYATKVHIHNGSVVGNVYGGGNAAKVVGDTRVVIGDDATLFTITATSSDPSKGSVSGGGSYRRDQDVSLLATPASGYRLKQWSNGSTDNPTLITVTGDQTITAEFEAIPQYTITVTANNPSMGTFTGGGTYDADRRVSISAVPNEGVRFTSWSDGVTYNPRSVKVTGNATYTAQFEEIPQWTLSVTPNNASYGSVSGGGTFYEGVIISVSATPSSDYLLRRWSDGETANPRTLSLTSNLSLTAIFEPIPTYTITVASNNSAWGSVTGGGSYKERTSVSLQAVPSAGYRFVKWDDGSAANPRTVTVSGAASYTAIFELIPTYTVTLAANNNAWGTVTGAGTYEENTRVTIQANPTRGYMFVQWSDGVNTNPRTFFATENVSLTAEFDENITQWIDLGLPSGTLWADRNIDAISPEGIGGYFAWAETSEKSNYVIGTTAYYNGSTYTKYNSTDGKMVLEPADDVSTQQLGAGAHVPEVVEWQELYNNCTKSMTTVNGVSGYRLTSKINGNSIFLPCSGRKYGTFVSGLNSGNYAHYWTATRVSNYSYAVVAMPYNSTGFYGNSTTTGEDRYYGLNVRAVKGEQHEITVVSANASMGTVSGGGTYYNGRSVTLTATPSSGYDFVQWQDGNTDNPRTVTVSGDATYTASFSALSTLPYTTGFEPTDDNGRWVLNNASYTNKWYIGSAAYKSGSQGLYISNDGGTSNDYTVTKECLVFASHNFYLEAGSHTLSFDWMCFGENGYDFIRVFLAPINSANPTSMSTAGIPSGWQDVVSGKLNLQSNWQSISRTFNVATSGAYRLVFVWRNDYSGGTQPPAAIDNVNFYKN